MEQYAYIRVSTKEQNIDRLGRNFNVLIWFIIMLITMTVNLAVIRKTNWPDWIGIQVLCK